MKSRYPVTVHYRIARFLMMPNSGDPIKVCSYHDRTSCVNNIVEKYIFSSEPELVKKCPPLCETTEYKVTQSRYNDPRDDRILRRRFNLGPEYKGKCIPMSKCLILNGPFNVCPSNRLFSCG